MKISVNGELTDISENFKISDLVEKLLLSQKKGIAVAINNTVIPKSLWGETVLKTGDNVLIIKATQGG